MNNTLLSVGITAALLWGCTVVPDVDVPYVLPKARILITVTQTLSCTGSDYIVSIANATITTSYVADYDGPRGSINFQAPDSWFVDTDTTVTRADDGRLLSLNAAYTGQGAAVVKGLVALAGTFATGGGARSAILPGPNPDFCHKLATHAGKKATSGGGDSNASTSPPTVNLTYTNQFDYVQEAASAKLTDQFGGTTVLDIGSSSAAPTAELTLPPDANSSPIATDLGSDLLVFTVTATLSGRGPDQPAPTTPPIPSDKNVIKVPLLSLVNLALQGPVGDLTKRVVTADAQIVVPTRNLVSVPIGKSQPFGKITTALTISPSGLMSKLEYNKSSGAADLITAATQVSTQAQQSQTPSQRAAEIQGEADLIYQQHRLVTCQASPANCQSK